MLVTGASRGVGRELALNYCRMGANVFITARDEKKLKEVTDSFMWKLVAFTDHVLRWNSFWDLRGHVAMLQVLSECQTIGRHGAIFGYISADMLQYRKEATRVIQVMIPDRDENPT